MQSLGGSNFARGQKNLTYVLLYLLFVCLFVHHALEWRGLWTPFHNQRIEYANLISLDTGKFVDAHPHSTFSVQRWAAPPQNDEVENTVKHGFLSLLGNSIHQFVWNLACNHRPRIYSSMLNLSQIGAGSGYRSTQTWKFGKNQFLVVFASHGRQYTYSGGQTYCITYSALMFMYIQPSYFTKLKMSTILSFWYFLKQMFTFSIMQNINICRGSVLWVRISHFAYKVPKH